jgi:hypothetical protein
MFDKDCRKSPSATHLPGRYEAATKEEQVTTNMMKEHNRQQTVI